MNAERPPAVPVALAARPPEGPPSVTARPRDPPAARPPGRPPGPATGSGQPALSSAPPGVRLGLAELPDAALLDEPALAAALDCVPRTVRAGVRRGELPPGVLIAGKRTWLAGRVRAWLAARSERAEREAERETARLKKISDSA